ncbi:MAG: hypothetical protein HWE27_01470 [Gammaproteobacteria bacterium]|nr:hypothetical protein [Gammaproteobacteria bacterium]
MTRITQTSSISKVLEAITADKKGKGSERKSTESSKGKDPVENLKRDIVNSISKISDQPDAYQLKKKLLIHKIIAHEFGDLINNSAQFSYITATVERSIEQDEKLSALIEKYLNKLEG